MNDKLYEQCLKLIRNHDNVWMKRKRKITTELIFKTLIAGALTNIGVSSCITAFGNNFSHVAMLKARQKIDSNLFKNVNTELNKNFNNHIYAIDGSKIRVHEGFKSFGYKSRTNDKIVPRPAKRPLAMLSALYGVQSNTIVDYTITKHFNERKCVKDLVSGLNKGDMVLMDRGYYSKELFQLFYNSSIHALFRLKKDANKSVEQFYKSRKRSLLSVLINGNSMIPIRYLKYFIDGKKYVLCTTDMNATNKQLERMYILRWGVETSFKRIKSYQNINTIYARTPDLWYQEMQIRILYDTLLIHRQQTTLSKKTKSKTKTSYNIVNLVLFLQILSIDIELVAVFNFKKVFSI